MNKPTLEQRAITYLSETARPNQGPCLIPRPGRDGVSSHENDFCECEVKRAFLAGMKVRESRAKKPEPNRQEIRLKRIQDLEAWLIQHHFKEAPAVLYGR